MTTYSVQLTTPMTGPFNPDNYRLKLMADHFNVTENGDLIFYNLGEIVSAIASGVWHSVWPVPTQD